MSTFERRYDIDWLRVIAIGLLLIYHTAIGFQPWGAMIGFITNTEHWPALWLPMSMLNVWRIPLLFFVSGMGVYFAMHKRTLPQLLGERALRIMLPYVFGMFAIVPLNMLIWQQHHQFPLSYAYHAGHLWFLANIFVYVLLLSPLFYLLRRHQGHRVVQAVTRFFGQPGVLVVVVGALVLEERLLKPGLYELYANTWHGFALGLLAFLFGYGFMMAGERFRSWTIRWRWVFVVLAAGLFVVRVLYFEVQVPRPLLVLESVCWIFAVLALGQRYLNRPSAPLSYLSSAAYPVYILHMVFLYLGSWLVFPLPISVYSKFLLVLLVTFGGCFGLYEIIRRVRWLRPLFGLKW